tara:strand:- start:25 stop:537 length:513 start_codon:yes stop_codon:yes gene_type:complete
MAIDKIQSESINLADNFAFTGTVTGAGGANTPAFLAYATSNQTINNTTSTKVNFAGEQLDSGSVYDTSNSRFTPGVSGYYWIGARWRYDTGDDFDTAQYRIYKNGSIYTKSTFVNQNANGAFLNTLVYSDDNDYFEMYAYHNKGSSAVVNGDSTFPEQDSAQFYGFKIIT